MSWYINISVELFSFTFDKTELFIELLAIYLGGRRRSLFATSYDRVIHRISYFECLYNIWYQYVYPQSVLDKE